MSDLTIADVIKMKVQDLRKELKSRGLPSTGDKAVLIERLQATLSNDTPDDHGDINLDSDDMTSEAAWILEDDEELLVDQPLPSTPIVKNYADEGNPETSLKRKIKDKKAKEPDSKTEENTSAKKIILNRATSTTSITASSVTSSPPVPTAEKTEEKDVKPDSSTNNDKIKIEPSGDKDRTQSRLELRAKRFGLPVKMTDDEKKEARKLRFGQTGTTKPGGAISKPPLGENLDKLKKRAERFGQSVSKFMTDIENKEKLEKRKAKFGTVK